MKDCLVQGNDGGGVRLVGNANGQLTDCRFVRNKGGVLDVDAGSAGLVCRGNVAVVSSPQQPLPGFRLETENEPNKEIADKIS